MCSVLRVYASDKQSGQTNEIILDSSAVEHSAVNRRVVGSNPTRGVFCIEEYKKKSGERFLWRKENKAPWSSG